MTVLGEDWAGHRKQVIEVGGVLDRRGHVTGAFHSLVGEEMRDQVKPWARQDFPQPEGGLNTV